MVVLIEERFPVACGFQNQEAAFTWTWSERRQIQVLTWN